MQTIALMLNRQKIVLGLLREVGGKASPLQLFKWCFLIAQESPGRGGDSFYEFVPYLHGPYSFGLHYELGSMSRDGLIRQTNDYWHLTPAGETYPISLASPRQADISFVVNRYRTSTTEDLLTSVYERYEWFTINAKKEENRAYSRPIAPAYVYTAGYERLQVDGFLNLLLESGIQRLIDVRANPVARRYGFHKSSLSALCNQLGIEYLHFPAVGIPTSWRSELKTLDDYEALFVRYEREILPMRKEEIECISSLLREKASVLVCQEADPRYCHRTRLANTISYNKQLPVKHIGWPR